MGMDPCLRSPGLLGTERDMPVAPAPAADAPFVSPFAKNKSKFEISFQLSENFNETHDLAALQRRTRYVHKIKLFQLLIISFSFFPRLFVKCKQQFESGYTI